jgi:hypothetical protein
MSSIDRLIDCVWSENVRSSPSTRSYTVECFCLFFIYLNNNLIYIHASKQTTPIHYRTVENCANSSEVNSGTVYEEEEKEEEDGAAASEAEVLRG